MNIYLICTGNTCRSPMAEALLRSRYINEVTVRSAGIHASNGMPISMNAKKLIEEAQLPHTPVSKSVTIEDIEWADVILTMTESHKQAMIHSFPDVKQKTYTLKEFAGFKKDKDVQDPFGGNLTQYKQTFDELSMLMDAVELKVIGGR